jgi:hypothetical protein
MLETFKNSNITASSFWKWDYQDAPIASFNLILHNATQAPTDQNSTQTPADQNSTLTPTEYYTYLKNSVAKIYPNLNPAN